MRHSTKLIEQLIGIGRARGLSAGAIATKAGLSPANLSRVRSAGRFNADTLERLLAAVDAEIEVKPRLRPPARTLPMVTRKLNAGRREQLTPQELRQLLTRFRRSAAAERAFSHLVGIIDELPIEQIHDLVVEGDAALPALKRIADYVDGDGPTVEWIDEQLSNTAKRHHAA